MADSAREALLTSDERSRAVSRVLVRVFLLNLVVAVAKLVYGYATGAISIVSDGFHSLTDSASNIAGLLGSRAARKPPDEDHPYGHRKYETLAAAAIFVFLLFAVIEVVQSSVGRFRTGEPPRVTAVSFAVMLTTLAVNLLVVRYESGRGRALRSELLLADAAHTRSDVLTSCAVLLALTGVMLGYPVLDPLSALVIAVFIARTGYQIGLQTLGILSDRVVIDEEAIRRAVMSVPEVVGCHQIRTRGTLDHAFLDLHVWFRPDITLYEAHRLSHIVKDRLMQKFPELADVIIHIEPPPV